MNEGDMILATLPQADGRVKNRPAVALRELPPYGDMLVCGVSAQAHQLVAGFDEWISRSDADFAASGLLAEIRSFAWVFWPCCPARAFWAASGPSLPNDTGGCCTA